MSVAAALHSGIRSDPGRQRTSNEDRVFADDARGVFLVVDGLGGHAAGEVAAEAAVQTIAGHMRSSAVGRDPESSIRSAITAANNRIFELAETHPEWKGMACVLTLALLQDDRLTVGHVGDSRLYLSWNGQLKKLTSDHSPVGEQEDQGLFTEDEAMHHPRRNEVFRDVGSHPRAADDPQFIEIKTFPFRADAALLLCSDGLSDLLTSAEISAVLERYSGNPDATAQQLIDAANRAGGKDNVSVVFVPGPEFLGSHSQTLADARPRHAITRTRDESGGRRALRNAAWLVAGMALGIALWTGIENLANQPQPQQLTSLRPPLLVNAADPHGMAKALAKARPGDTIQVAPGDYVGPVELKDHVNIVGQRSSVEVKLRSDPYSATDAGLAVVARAITSAHIEGLHIIGDETHPLRTGVWLANSSIEVADLDISGAIESGIQIEGGQPTLLANFIHSNVGPGVVIKNHAAPRLIGNWIVENGTIPKALRPGIEAESDGLFLLSHNVVTRNGVENQFSGNPPTGKPK